METTLKPNEKMMELDNTANVGIAEKKPGGFKAVLAIRNFRLLWVGESISLLGDQFYMIALPWLVLQLTGSALAMGTVLAVAGIPRALFMLIGGALTDRFSPRALMIWSNLVRMIFVGLLAGLVLTGSIQLWTLYALALIFGLADAFFYPAQSSIIPRLVGMDKLQAANSLAQGMGQLSLFVGPALAGVIIALLDGGAVKISGQAVPDMRGIAVVFALDAASFLVSLACLYLIRLEKSEGDQQAGEQAGMLSSIRECVVYVWNDHSMRLWFVLIAAMNVLVTGPFSVGIPVLARERFIEGAVAFGIFVSAYGGGSLVGIILAGVLPKLPKRTMGYYLLTLSTLLGIAVALLGVADTIFWLAAISLLMGVMDGYVVIQFITWLQVRTPAAMMGRVMSMLMFAVVGLGPVSNAISGAAISLSTTGLFVVAGLLLSGMCVAAAFNSAVKDTGEVPQIDAAS
jgi:MFS family permease